MNRNTISIRKLITATRLAAKALILKRSLTNSARTTFTTVILAGILIAGFVWSCSKKTETDFSNRPLTKFGTFRELLKIDSRGGKILDIPGFNLSKPGAKWELNDLTFKFEKVDGEAGCYRLTGTGDMDSENSIGLSNGYVNFQPNRRYVLSVLIKSDYNRIQNHEYGGEINVGLNTDDYEGKIKIDSSDSEDAINWKQRAYNCGYMNGLPNETRGWVRWEWEFTTADRAGKGKFWFRVFALKKYDFCIADAKFIELPLIPLVPLKKGEGVTFRGGPGNLPMEVKEVKKEDTVLTISTTGSSYKIDPVKNTIIGHQLIELRRTVCVWKSSLPLENLEIISQTKEVCVLANEYMTLGLQCDGMLMIAPQKELNLTAENKIGGKWNRLISGQLISLDDYGGYTVNPAIPLGSGRLPDVEVLTPDLDFIGKINDVDFVSNASPGWEVKWRVSPGERIALSVFPPRPFDWKASFHMIAENISPKMNIEKYPLSFKDTVDVGILWDFQIRGYGLSYGKEILPMNEAETFAHIKALKSVGVKPVNYMSAHFYYSRDPQEYINEVKRWKDKYGIEGIYSDGIPTPEWLVSYEEVRMLRELFPDGTIIIHTTGQPYNGGPPVHLPDIFQPFIDTYASATLRGEWVLTTEGENWQFPRYISSQFRKANCVGMLKTDRWFGVEPVRKDIISLVYNGRPWHMKKDKNDMTYTLFKNEYLAKQRILERLWEEKGKDPDFYNKYYLPKVEELTRFNRKN